MLLSCCRGHLRLWRVIELEDFTKNASISPAT